FYLDCSVTLHSSLVCQRTAPHRELHSFPTRRSSDLPTGDGGPGIEHGGSDRGMVRLHGLLELRRVSMHLVRGQENFGRAAPHHQDRKSTRLNSSHGSISYAVFCLKKKNTHHNRISNN